jgi:hypothetical protein
MLRMYFAWKNGDRGAAGEVALPAAVKVLFDMPFDPSARVLGCGTVGDGSERCVIRRPSDLILLTPQTTDVGRVYILSVEVGALDYPITYERPGAPTPTP